MKDISESKEIRPENKDLFFEYLRYKQSQCLTLRRLERVSVAMKHILKFVIMISKLLMTRKLKILLSL